MKSSLFSRNLFSKDSAKRLIFITILSLIIPQYINVEPAHAVDCTPTSTTVGGRTIQSFISTTTCDWAVPAGVTSIRYLVVGGGGSGGSGRGGGGGAGGLLRGNSSVTASQILSIKVGTGGTGSSSTGNNTNGDTSTISGTGISLIAPGGGKGGSHRNAQVQDDSIESGSAGGSGGGGSINYSAYGNLGGSAIGGSVIGFRGAGSNSDLCASRGTNNNLNRNTGGGGGAGSAGTVGCNTTSEVDGGTAPNGGNGLADTITGTSVIYATGGGGAGGRGQDSQGGSCEAGIYSSGSGDGGSSNVNGGRGQDCDSELSAVVANRGAGGGGVTRGAGGNGGSGIVIISYVTGPASVNSGLLLWLDASDPDNDGDNSNNPSDGTSVTSWTDKSSNSNNARILSGQGSPTYRPTSNINSVPAMRFARSTNTSGQVFEVPGVDIRATSRPDVTIFSVYRSSNSVNGDLFGVWGQDNGQWDRFFICCGYNGATNGVVGQGVSSAGFQVNGAGNSTTRLVTTVYNGDTTSGSNSGPTLGSAIYFDGSQVNTFTDNTHITNAQSTFRIGWDGDDSTFNGDIAEVIIYDRVLTSTELTTVSDYLADKYGITLAPTVTTNAATSITQTSATLNAVVNAHGDTTTALTLRYSTDSNTVGTGTSPTVTPSSVSSSTNVSVSASITGLTQNTTYYFRVSATNSKGSNTGSIVSFRTSNVPIVTSCSGAGALSNGSFESGSTDWRTTALDGGFEIWGPDNIVQNRTSTTRITAPSNAYSYDGSRIAEIAANNGGDGPNSRQGLYQDVNTINGSRIFWSYWHKHRNGVTTADQVASFRAAPTPTSGTRPAGSTWTSAEQEDPFNGATLLANVNHTVSVDSAWTQSSGTFQANSSTTRFLFNNVTSPAAGFGNLIDDVRFTTYSACPITVKIIAGRSSNFVIRNNEQSSTNFVYYGPQAASISSLTGVSTGLTASYSNTSNTSSTFTLSASAVGTYSANYEISYTFDGTPYYTASTLNIEVVPEVTSRAPSILPVDPTLTSKTLSGISFATASNVYVCIDQVDSSGNVLLPSTITVNQGSLVSGVTAISSSPFTDSATVTAMTSQMSRVRIQANSGVLGRGGTKYIRVRAASIDNTDGVARSCDNGISYRIEIRIMPKTKVVRKVVNLVNGKQRQ